MGLFGRGRALALVMAAAVTLGVGTAKADEAREDAAAHRYRLHMHNLHTDEDIDVVYRIGDEYIPEALNKLNYFLRDRHTFDVVDYDPREFDLLHSIMARLGKASGVIDIVCGYRTAETNASLRNMSANSGVAEHSQHIEGRAIDIRVPGVTTAKLKNTAESFEAGGVGYYPRSQFVHVDVGPVRTWTFGGRRPSLRLAKYHRHHRSHRGVIHQMGN